MSGRVIQGFFVDGGAKSRMLTRHIAPPPHPVAFGSENRSGAPSPAFARPVPAARSAMPLQPFSSGQSVAIDPTRIGLVQRGGRPLPGPLLAKMESAFRADFSGVRVHVGAQASRIGALAFATGDDLYFAPGHFQPDSVRGQHLIGHELAHVIQQRQGRARAPGSGVAIIQDRMLESEAELLGQRAAHHLENVHAGPRATAFAARPGNRMVQRSAASLHKDHQHGANQSEIHLVALTTKVDTLPSKGKLEHLVGGTALESPKRSYVAQREVQILRWIATTLFSAFPDAVEIQCYWTGKAVIISSNKTSVNGKINAVKGKLGQLLSQSHYGKSGRLARHASKLFVRGKYAEQRPIYDALMNGLILVPDADYKDGDLHAERRIQKYLGTPLDPKMLGGVKRPCMICAHALGLQGHKRGGPLWPSGAATIGYTSDQVRQVLDHAVANGVITAVSRDRVTKKLTTGHDSDSDSGPD